LNIRLLSVGKPKEPEAGLICERYVRRIESLGVGFETAWVPEVTPGSRFSDDHVREREARSLSERIAASERSTVVALDRRGSAIDSRELARRLPRWAAPRATFVIGGPLGLHQRLLDEAGFVWSLSPLTFPHELTRALVVEQLYRALTLIRGLPYHK
jgi:23S rRNA (pseudouridine1915-N3)-methyltransferase